MSGYINKDAPSSSPKIMSYNEGMPSSSPKISSGKTEVLSGKEQATMDLAKREFAKSVFTAGVEILRDFNSLSYCELSPEFIAEYPDYVSQFTAKSVEIFGAGTTLQLAALYNLNDIASVILTTEAYLKEISKEDLQEANDLVSGNENIKSHHLDYLNLENSSERFTTMMRSNAYCLRKFGEKFFRELCIKFR